MRKTLYKVIIYEPFGKKIFEALYEPTIKMLMPVVGLVEIVLSIKEKIFEQKGKNETDTTKKEEKFYC